MRRSPLVSLCCTAVAATMLAAALTSCQTGQRPTLESVVDVVDDPSTNSVLERLARADSGEFVATYAITPTLQGTATVTATVARREGQRRIQIGNVVYLVEDGRSSTCENGLGGCVEYTDDARVSDLNVTSNFWGAAFAARLANDARRRIGSTVGHAEEIAGLPAICVDIPPSASYCALDSGVLARYIGADVTIELTSFTRTVEDSDFA